jgi:hypothetical protein
MNRTLLAGLLGALMSGAVAAEQPLPVRILESEQSVIGEWVFSGRTGKAVWANGVAAELTIEQYDAERVIIRRRDTTAITHDLTAVYTGKLQGAHVSGQVVYTWPGHFGDKPASAPWAGDIATAGAAPSSLPPAELKPDDSPPLNLRPGAWHLDVSTLAKSHSPIPEGMFPGATPSERAAAIADIRRQEEAVQPKQSVAELCLPQQEYLVTSFPQHVEKDCTREWVSRNTLAELHIFCPQGSNRASSREQVIRFKRLDEKRYEASYAEKIGGASGFTTSTTIAATGQWLRDSCATPPH